MKISITPVTSSRLQSVDFDDLGFGRFYSDHMFSMIHENDQWRDPQIVPFAPVPVHPANAALHYGQAVFEGLKAYRTDSGQIQLFRPQENLKRLNRSCRRICIPEIDEDFALDAMKQLIALEKDWVPGAP